jgi:hypothetical protein
VYNAKNVCKLWIQVFHKASATIDTWRCLLYSSDPINEYVYEVEDLLRNSFDDRSSF